MKKIILFLMLITTQCSMYSQKKTLQNYPEGIGCPTLLLSCITRPPLPMVGGFGKINNNTIVDLQIENHPYTIEANQEVTFKKNVFFPQLANKPTKSDEKPTITIASLAVKTLPGKITVELDNTDNIIIFNSYVGTDFISQRSLELGSLYDRDAPADFLKNLNNNYMYPDPIEDNNREYKYYFDNIIKNIKNGTDVCNLHVAQWTVDFDIDSSFSVNIRRLNLLFKYPIMKRVPTVEEMQQGTYDLSQSPCDFKTFGYYIERDVLLSEEILKEPKTKEVADQKTDDTTQKTNGDSGQSTTT